MHFASASGDYRSRQREAADVVIQIRLSSAPQVGAAHFSNIRFIASHAARCIACHGVRSHAVPVALVGESSMPVVST